MPNTTVSVAQYGHPLLKGAKHWSLLLLKPGGYAVAYQLSGSTDTYAFKDPEEIQIRKSQTYMGRVDIGNVDATKLGRVDKVLRSVPITRGNLQWNCQNWVIQALYALQNDGFAVDALTLEDLQAKLQLVKRDE